MDVFVCCRNVPGGEVVVLFTAVFDNLEASCLRSHDGDQ